MLSQWFLCLGQKTNLDNDVKKLVDATDTGNKRCSDWGSKFNIWPGCGTRRVTAQDPEQAILTVKHDGLRLEQGS